MQGEAAGFDAKHTADKNLKEEHLRLFRPNLENPANKEATKELNEKEQRRCEEFKDLIDDTQLNLLTAEEETSQLFHVAYLNNVRAMIAIFDKLIPRTDFIMLPGDEIVEKKHANIKMLTAQMESADLSKRSTRKWPGLGPNVFIVDYGALFEDFKEFKDDEEDAAEATAPPTQAPPAKGKGAEAEAPKKDDTKDNEIACEVEVQNTDHHKAIIKARNEHYLAYKERFQLSLTATMAKYDALRKEENRFNQYWASNLAEITKKHI